MGGGRGAEDIKRGFRTEGACKIPWDCIDSYKPVGHHSVNYVGYADFSREGGLWIGSVLAEVEKPRKLKESVFRFTPKERFDHTIP